jgi:hypothetical protein
MVGGMAVYYLSHPEKARHLRAHLLDLYHEASHGSTIGHQEFRNYLFSYLNHPETLNEFPISPAQIIPAFEIPPSPSIQIFLSTKLSALAKRLIPSSRSHSLPTLNLKPVVKKPASRKFHSSSHRS